jgi:hypothetical protein
MLCIRHIKKGYTAAWIITDIFLVLYSAPLQMAAYVDNDEYITRKGRDLLSLAAQSNGLAGACFVR